MNAAIFWRIFWKEWRTQRAFWISIAVLTLVLDLLILALSWHLHDVRGRAQGMFIVASLLAAFYALGSGATLFATERETGTYDFLRALPVTPLAVFAGKIAFALASTAAMFVVACILTAVFARGLPDPHFQLQIWALFGLGGVELMAWGILFSLLLKRPLLAVILAGDVRLDQLGGHFDDHGRRAELEHRIPMMPI